MDEFGPGLNNGSACLVCPGVGSAALVGHCFSVVTFDEKSKRVVWGWRDGPGVKRTPCSSRPEFSSQASMYGCSQLPVASVLGDWTSSFGLLACVRAHTHIFKNYKVVV